ncbi:MAG: transporter substrate-binding domain-containing protein [Rhizobiales bacterium]|nr:transporter substrate-binding domain-containing protein [Rhizobacter sp.]
MKRFALIAALSVCGLAVQAQTATEATTTTLDAVIKKGVLRACTPGDYKPFSFLKPDGAYEGIDIDLANSLAAAMGAKLELVKTSWANLMPDFTAGKCDVAIGGISVTLDRQKRAGFSTAYMVNGKTPIARCEDVTRFQTVADIDKPGVRVIANPGGSNERFAKANFKTATLTIHPENLTIFDEIVAKRADVFVTEAAEALTQQKLKPGLCAVNPEKPLQYGEMAWLLPRGDAVTKDFVDQWLHLAKATGEYQRTVDKWLK